MFGKKKDKKKEVQTDNKDIQSEKNDEISLDLPEIDDIDDTKEDKVLADDDLLPQEIEEKNKKEKEEQLKEEKEKKKAEKKEYKKEHGAVATFKMYKFIVKIVVFAILITFGILMLVFKDELIGAVYIVSGIVILFSALIRLIPLLKTTTSKRAKMVMLVQVIIHIVIGAYLIIAAFYHWDKIAQIKENSDLKGKDLMEQLDSISGGGFAKFNIEAYGYILVIFFYTYAVGYYWTTILYNEKTNRSLFWLNTIAITLAVVLGILADKLDAQKLVITLAIIALLSGVVIGGEATGGYIQYRKKITADKPKKEKSKDKGKEAPAKDKKKIDEIDPNIIPKNDIKDQDSIVS